MTWLHTVSLVSIAALWLVMWRTGLQWVGVCGVEDRVTRWSLATVPATAGVVLAVHVPAFLSLYTGSGFVAPAFVAIVFLMLTVLARLLVCYLLRCPEDGQRKEFLSLPGGDRERSRPSVKTPLCPTLVRGEELAAGSWTIPALPLVMIVGLYLLFFVEALTRYPTGYDGLHYHLPQAIHWMQTGSLDLMVGQMHRSLPDNAMLVPMLLSFAGLEKIITVFNVPNGLLLGAAIWGLCRAMRLGRPASAVAACIALSVPVVVFQTFSSYVDLYATAAWLLSLLALVWACRPQSRRQQLGLIVLAGLAGGVALGCKTTYLVLVFFLVVIACALEWVADRSAPGRMGRSLRGGLIFSIVVLACSAFWFVRGAVQAGNPIYPLGVTVAGAEILPGFVDDDWFPQRSLATKVQRWWHYPWTEPKYAGSGETYSVNNGLGGAYAAFVPIGLAFAVLLMIRRCRRQPEDRFTLVFAIIALAGVGLLLTVFEEVLRYVLGPVLLAIPVSALLYQRLQIRFPRAVGVVVNASLLVTVMVAALPPARALAGRVRDGSWSRRAFYQIPDVINLLPSGTRILNLAPPSYTYPLYGLRFANDVIPGTLWNTATGGGAVTAANLDAHRIEYIFLRQPPPGRPWPDERWPDDLSVQCIYDDSPYFTDHPTPASKLYRVNKTALAARSPR